MNTAPIILITGMFFWAIALVIIGRLLFISINREPFSASRWLLLLYCLSAVLAVFLFFRPHEDIFGGEDPGSYINSGITYGRNNTFFYVDPLLAEVPVGVRSNFFYGHDQYGTTKDACLWVRDVEKAIVGPHFQPAYPLLISVASKIGSVSWSLYVVPLFALFAAIAIYSLAQQLIPNRWAGLVAFLLYIFCPLTVWHARCARPEIIASFMFFGGCALLLHVFLNRNRLSWIWIIAGALGISCAPFFHITAWLLVIPAAAVIGLVILRGRDDFLLYPLVALCMLLAFFYQTAHVTDYYRAGRFFAILTDHPVLALLGIVSLLLLLAVACLITKRYLKDRTSPAVSLPLAAILAAVTVLFFMVTFFTRDAIGSLPILGRPVRNTLYLTNFNAFVNMVSLPMALLALAGWAAWLTGASTRRRERIVFALVLLPGMFLAGNINDFMMTRYLMLTVIPMFVLSLAALIALIPDRRNLAWATGLLTIVVCVLGLYNRTHLVTLREHQGLANFIRPFAEIVKKNNGILLCEYSRIAAPFEHFFGIPTLGLDNERQNDYSAAEQAWESIMQNHADQPAYFLTPFHEPLSARFHFNLVRKAELQDRTLQQAYQNLPTQIKQGPLSLALYRMHTSDRTETAPAPFVFPYVFPVDAGNMGLRDFANTRVESFKMTGMRLVAEEKISLMLPSVSQGSSHKEVFCIFSIDPNETTLPTTNLSPLIENTAGRYLHLINNWWAYCAVLTDDGPYCLTSALPLFLVEIILKADNQLLSLSSEFPKSRLSRRQAIPLLARWTRADAQICLPLPDEKKVNLFCLFYAPENDRGDITRLNVGNESMRQMETIQVERGNWQWRVFVFDRQETHPATAWFKIKVEPAWDSRIAGFPSDLGILLGHMIVSP